MPKSASAKKLPPSQLYDLALDIGETKNLIGNQPGKAAALEKELGDLVAKGRSRPGPKQQNFEPVKIRP